MVVDWDVKHQRKKHTNTLRKKDKCKTDFAEHFIAFFYE